MRCILAQLEVPISYWEEAARYSSMLVNLLPSLALLWKSPINVLLDVNSTIEPVRNVLTLIPFGLKVNVHSPQGHKLDMQSKPLFFLGYEPYYDAGRFIDPTKRQVTSMCLRGQDKVTDRQPLSTSTSIPLTETTGKRIKLPTSPSQEPLSVSPVPPSSSPAHIQESDSIDAQGLDLTTPSPPTMPSTSDQPASKGYTYVPYYGTAPKNINLDIDPAAIILTSRRRGRQQDPNTNDNKLMISEVVSVDKAMSDPHERTLWIQSMKDENNSHLLRETGTLVPRPQDDKVIGGMWRLVQKKNKFGEVTQQKSRWVCFGNHQEYPRHYLDTYSSVGQSESMRVLLADAVQHDHHVFQFNVETAFLYGDIDAVIHVSQVAGFKVPGKEDWVWRLNKSLYGTRQAPWCWRAHLVSTLANLGLEPLAGDESIFINKSKSL